MLVGRKRKPVNPQNHPLVVKVFAEIDKRPETLENFAVRTGYASAHIRAIRNGTVKNVTVHTLVNIVNAAGFDLVLQPRVRK